MAKEFTGENMSKINRQIAIILMLLGIGSLYATGHQESPEVAVVGQEKAFEPIIVTDILGRRVTIDKPVERIAFSHPGTAEALNILNVWDRVVARAGYTNDENLFPGVKDIPALGPLMGNPYEPNYELLYDLDVDLLIVEAIPMPGIEEMLASLEGIIPVVVVKLYEPAGLIDGLDAIGQLLGKRDEANAYIKWYTAVLDTLSDKTANLTDMEKPHIFFKHGYGAPGDLMTFTDELSYVPFRNRVTGSVNIAADLPSQGGWVSAVDPEWLIAQPLDVLVIADPLPGSFGTTVSKESKVVQQHSKAVESLPVFAGSKAVKEHRVYSMGDGLFGSPRFIVGFAYMAKWFHPDLFTDFDPQKIHQEYLTEFMRIDYDLDDKGVFVYPEN